MAAGGGMRSLEPFPRSGSPLEEICANGKAVVLSREQAGRMLQRFEGIYATDAMHETHVVVLPLYGREHNILAIAAGVNSACACVYTRRPRIPGPARDSDRTRDRECAAASGERKAPQPA